MKENFEIIKAQVDIKNLAVYLLGGPERGMFKYPGEKTASIKIYSQTNSFFDFGRGVGGDCIKLWSHIRHCDSWTALQEVAIVFGISTTLTEADKENIIAKIKAQETAQKERRRAEKRNRQRWAAQVDKLHEELELYDSLLNSLHISPMSWIWTWCMNGKQMAEYRLDCLCGIYN